LSKTGPAKPNHVSIPTEDLAFDPEYPYAFFDRATMKRVRGERRETVMADQACSQAELDAFRDALNAAFIARSGDILTCGTCHSRFARKDVVMVRHSVVRGDEYVRTGYSYESPCCRGVVLDPNAGPLGHILVGDAMANGLPLEQRVRTVKCLEPHERALWCQACNLPFKRDEIVVRHHTDDQTSFHWKTERSPCCGAAIEASDQGLRSDRVFLFSSLSNTPCLTGYEPSGPCDVYAVVRKPK
jgi:hypothetical protein